MPLPHEDKFLKMKIGLFFSSTTLWARVTQEGINYASVVQFFRSLLTVVEL